MPHRVVAIGEEFLNCNHPAIPLGLPDLAKASYERLAPFKYIEGNRTSPADFSYHDVVQQGQVRQRQIGSDNLDWNRLSAAHYDSRRVPQAANDLTECK